MWKGQLAPTPSLMGSVQQAKGDHPRVVGMRTRSSIKKKPDLIDRLMNSIEYIALEIPIPQGA